MTLEERIYRMRCVEGWSMVIPWVGFPLAELLKRVEPHGSAKYVAFETLVRPSRDARPARPVPGADWPYVEGLRLDEAMHPLTILAVGLYGETLPNQNGAPIRLVVPWKYGFKSIKSIVRISLDREGAADHLEAAERQRVRLLFQRQPGGRSSALEPGDRAAHRRGRAAGQAPADAAVQRLRRSGREPLRRHGPQSQLLRWPDPHPLPGRDALLLGTDPIRRAIYIVGMVPAVWYFYLGITDQLGADPQKTLERLLGLWALRFLILSLADHAAAPARRAQSHPLPPRRRPARLLLRCLHLTVYMVLDQGLDLAAIWADIVKRPYITVGMFAFLILVPLAVTSNNAMIRRLGGGAWQRLHRLVYVAAAAAAIHFVMVVKAWPPEPLIYAGIVAVLLLFRLWLYVQKKLRPKHARKTCTGSRLTHEQPR